MQVLQCHESLHCCIRCQAAEYAQAKPTAGERVRWLLGKLKSDEVHKTKHVHKFVHNVESVFASLPRQIEWRSFLEHDLPLLNLPTEVLEIAVFSTSQVNPF